MAEPSLPWTGRTRAALEWGGQADSGAGIGDGGVGGVSDVLVVT